jgi:hypothetical protein
MSTPAKRILFVSKLYNGSVHDKKMADEQLKDKAALFKAKFKAKELRVDLGFLGIDKQLQDCQVEIPEKKKKKQELTLAQKRATQEKGKNRLCIEHAIGGMKRYRLIMERIRIRKLSLLDTLVGICAGLWNFHSGFFSHYQ